MKTLATSFALLIAAVTFTACSTSTIDPAPATPRAVHIAKPDSILTPDRMSNDDIIPAKTGREKLDVLSEAPVSTIRNPNPASIPGENAAPVRKPRQDVMPVDQIEAVN
ncbi:hypothetical protein [Spirosoma pomorum]|jgi:hypothetical protein